MDKLKSLQLFQAVVRHGSFAKAARILNSDPSTISKAMQRLEQHLGVQLIQRNTRKLNVTPMGVRYLEYVEGMLEGLSTIEDEIKEITGEPKGLLKINLPVSYGRLYIQPLIPEFCRRFPLLEIELHFDDNYVDIIEQGFDVSIRSGSLQDNRVVARKLSPMDFIMCAAPGYLEENSIQRMTEKNARMLPWIRFRFKQSGKLMPIFVLRKGERVIWDVNQKFVVDDGEAMIELCKSNMGLTQVPHFLARNALSEHALVPIFRAFSAPNNGVFALYPKREYLPEKVRLFIDYIRQSLNDIGETPSATWAKNLTIR